MADKEQISEELKAQLFNEVFMKKKVYKFIKKCRFSTNIYYNAMDGGKIKVSHIDKMKSVLETNKF